MTKTKTLSKRQRGLSLVELMVALSIGLVLSGAAVLIYAHSKHAFGMQDNSASIQENGRFALHLIKQDVRLAGYWGLSYLPDNIDTAEAISLTNECAGGWSTDVTQPIAALNNTNVGVAGCIPDADYQVNTDILTVRRASSEPIDTGNIVAGNIYLRASMTSGALFIADSDGAVDSAADIPEVPASNHLLMAHAYYVRPWSQTLGDGIPTLVRETISGTTVSAEPLVDYVEDFQLTFGLDTDLDGNVDRYDNNGITADEVEDVMTIVVEVLIRAPNGEADYTNSRTYQLGDRTHAAANDSIRRQVFRETIFVRNWSGLGSV